MVGQHSSSETNAPPDQTLAIVPTGIADDPRCISDLDQLAARAVQEVKPINNRLAIGGKQIEQIVVGGPECIASAIDDHTPKSTNVTNHRTSAKRYLDDTQVVGDGYEIPSVKRDRPQIAHRLASEGRLSEDAIPDFDLQDATDRPRVTSYIIRKLAPRRYHRAKQKAQSNRLEQILNDWYDDTPTANHALILEDGRNTYQHLMNHMNGNGKWVKYPTSCDGHIRTVELDGSKSGCVSNILAAVFDPRHRTHVQYQHLTSEQREQAYQWLTESGCRDIGFPPKRDHPDSQQDSTPAQTSAIAD